MINRKKVKAQNWHLRKEVIKTERSPPVCMLIAQPFIIQKVTVFKDWAFEEAIMQGEVIRVSLIQYTLPGKVLRTYNHGGRTK